MDLKEMRCVDVGCIHLPHG